MSHQIENTGKLADPIVVYLKVLGGSAIPETTNVKRILITPRLLPNKPKVVSASSLVYSVELIDQKWQVTRWCQLVAKLTWDCKVTLLRKVYSLLHYQRPARLGS